MSPSFNSGRWLRADHFIGYRPDLLFRAFDQTAHRTGGIENETDLDARFGFEMLAQSWRTAVAKAKDCEGRQDYRQSADVTSS